MVPILVKQEIQESVILHFQWSLVLLFIFRDILIPLAATTSTTVTNNTHHFKKWLVGCTVWVQENITKDEK